MLFVAFKAFAGLLFYDLLVGTRGFNAVYRRVKRWPVSKRQVPSDAIGLVLSAVDRACVLYPHRAMCLHRSAVITCMLRTLGVSAVMIIGARKIPFRAHAWVEVSGTPINEGKRAREFYEVLECC